MEFINGGKIVSLMRYPEKKAPAVVEKELILKQDFGIEGDHHADGGERQISLLTLKEKEWMQNQEVKGFCFKKYKENILLDGISLSECKKGDLIKCGDAVDLALEAVRFIVNNHAGTAGAQMGVVVHAEEHIILHIALGNGTEKTAHRIILL